MHARNRNRQSFCIRCGVTMVEVLTALAVIGVLLAVLLPAIQSARSASRRIACQNHIRQIGIAIENYVDTYRVLPSEGPDFWPYRVRLLGFLEQHAAAADFAANSKASLKHQHTNIPVYHCPNEPLSSALSTNYGMNWGTAGSISKDAFFSTRFLTYSEVIDGLSNTAIVSESTVTDPMSPKTWWRQLNCAIRPSPQVAAAACRNSPPGLDCSLGSMGSPWTSRTACRYGHGVRPNLAPCKVDSDMQFWPAGSHHTGGVHVLFVDSHVRFISEEIDGAVWGAIGTRGGSEVISTSD